ncbi:hypothetical protein AWB80_08426 [Caballeronia pedi]|uniref:Uncharacterized protein n=1 Tax=Caballeronia pedi TaxID=1777141 RepID=A0A158E769_9BURK|nr:protealysin inhibitor emfourin [Caballeronia pedi]SAL02725.1 hypothetical protein AWB80_08426 [Caballeronia pedi]
MQAELFIEGGVGYFPGLARPIVLQAADLSPGESAEFARLISAARAEGGATRPSARKPMPDARSYRISIAGDDGKLELKAADPGVPPAFAALMNFLKQHGHR